MRGTVPYGLRNVRLQERNAPKILKRTDAIIRILALCVSVTACGSAVAVGPSGRRILFARSYPWTSRAVHYE